MELLGEDFATPQHFATLQRDFTTLQQDLATRPKDFATLQQDLDSRLMITACNICSDAIGELNTILSLRSTKHGTIKQRNLLTSLVGFILLPIMVMGIELDSRGHEMREHLESFLNYSAYSTRPHFHLREEYIS
jgi:hypothetical protein